MEQPLPGHVVSQGMPRDASASPWRAGPKARRLPSPWSDRREAEMADPGVAEPPGEPGSSAGAEIRSINQRDRQAKREAGEGPAGPKAPHIYYIFI